MTERQRGVLYAVAGGVFWGGSGVAGQYLLQDAGFTTEWLVTARLVLAGVILLALDVAQHSGDIFRVWRSRRNFAELLFYTTSAFDGVFQNLPNFFFGHALIRMVEF